MSTQSVALDTDKLFIGGEWVLAAGGGRIDVVSPSTEEHVGSVPDGSQADMDAAVAAAAHLRGPGGMTIVESGKPR